ncbi:Uncharacterised protein [Mycobacteroides abscessus subsp. abscessus]|nr:Uncharacterised protein [Mycobacteroides abscessus subsp. abscessus]
MSNSVYGRLPLSRNDTTGIADPSVITSKCSLLPSSSPNQRAVSDRQRITCAYPARPSRRKL